MRPRSRIDNADNDRLARDSTNDRMADDWALDKLLPNAGRRLRRSAESAKQLRAQSETTRDRSPAPRATA